MTDTTTVTPATVAPEPTIHLKNTITAEIGHMRNTPDFEWNHLIGERILAVIAAHHGCSCGYGAQPATETAAEATSEAAS